MSSRTKEAQNLGEFFPQKGAEKGSELKEIELPQPSYERLKQLK
jgi:hypothetical protein